jgi:predicted YcjX-like family ATPase
MTSALMRGSNVESTVDKFLVLPEERENQFKNKLTSPLFKEHFEQDNWKLIYFDTLRTAYIKSKNDLDVRSIIDQKTLAAKKTGVADKEQGQLF